MERHDALLPFDSLEACKILVTREWPEDELALGLAHGYLADKMRQDPTWPEYLRRKGEKWGANPYALGQALRYLGTQSRGESVSPLRHLDTRQTPQDAPGSTDRLTEVVRATEGRESIVGHPGASGGVEAKS